MNIKSLDLQHSHMHMQTRFNIIWLSSSNILLFFFFCVFIDILLFFTWFLQYQLNDTLLVFCMYVFFLMIFVKKRFHWLNDNQTPCKTYWYLYWMLNNWLQCKYFTPKTSINYVQIFSTENVNWVKTSIIALLCFFYLKILFMDTFTHKYTYIYTNWKLL